MTTRPFDSLDVTGTLCPVPVLRTARRVRRLAPGALLEVVGDDPLMRLDLAAWCAKEGHDVVVMEEAGGRIHCVLRVGSGTAA
ncbi:MAG TPA: sulfurtransferase TusA family protein [Thermoanaerobaculia bacterium]|nr:sulfurtransferase TusA family protein [Thermoanaerobaculia bacterium]